MKLVKVVFSIILLVGMSSFAKESSKTKMKNTKQTRGIASVSNVMDCDLEKKSTGKPGVNEKFKVKLSYSCNGEVGCAENEDHYEGDAPSSSLLPNYRLNFKVTYDAEGGYIQATVYRLGNKIISKKTKFSGLDTNNDLGIEQLTYLYTKSKLVSFKSADNKEFNVICGIPEEQ